MSSFVPENIEAVCLEIIKPKTQPILLTTVYRPPSSNTNFMDDLENYLHILDGQDKELILTGDLNCDLSLSVLQSHSRRLMDILELFQMKQVIADPTRITNNTASLLDIIATNRPEKVKESGVIHMGISDHSLMYTCLKVSVPREKTEIRCEMNKRDYLKKRAVKSNSKTLYRHYQLKRNEVNK